MRRQDSYHLNVDGLRPVLPIDLANISTTSQLLHAFEQASFGARRLGEAASVLEAMVNDPDCFTVLTLSGAMTVAKLGLVICEMIERGYVQCIISTGAIMTHGLVETLGRCHYKYCSDIDDAQLYASGYNRVYDTIEPESNLDEAEELLSRVLEQESLPEVLYSTVITQAIGRHLDAHMPNGRGPLLSAYRFQVPIIIPAFTDSELGLDYAVYNQKRIRAGQAPLSYNPFQDLEIYTALARNAKRLGIFTIGGGVPRNYAQQVGPYVEILAHRLRDEQSSPVRFTYGVRICPDPDHLGGLSGCTYQEGVSWGKFLSQKEGGRFAEVLTDATIAWPLIVKAVMERSPFKSSNHVKG